MKKVALIFSLAILLPCLVLAIIAFRSIKDEELILEHQRVLLYRNQADLLMRDLDAIIAKHRHDFNEKVQALLADRKPMDMVNKFDEELRKQWSMAEVGFAVSLKGEMYAPSMFGGIEARQFRLENDLFLCNKEVVEVFWNSPKGSINLSRLDREKEEYGTKGVYATKGGKTAPAATVDLPFEGEGKGTEAEFRRLVGDGSEGTLARFLRNKLNLLLWYRPPADPNLVFGAKLNLGKVVREFGEAFTLPESMNSEICALLRDDQGQVVLASRPNFNGTLRNPFVRTEMGDVLPHWEISIHLLNPGSITATAQSLKLTWTLLVAALVFAVGFGSWLVITDVRRQLALSRQKTDFVSNVSHELKTPLTAIRMFAEILAEGRVSTEEKKKQYLGIITAEAARLTRLINNVLDFSRMERGDKKYHFEQIDLRTLVEDAGQLFSHQLTANGGKFSVAQSANPLWVKADKDALSQIISNLLSNADKYGGKVKATGLQTFASEGVGYVEVADAGLGIPRGEEAKIFEQFYRAHDNLDSGIEGSGLGLTIARQMAQAHGGDISYRPNEGGGSIFTLTLPLVKM